MGPGEVEELLFMEPFEPFRITLASGDQITVDIEDKPFVSGLVLILRGDRDGGRITAGSRLLSIPNIVLVEPLGRRPTGRRRRTK